MLIVIEKRILRALAGLGCVLLVLTWLPAEKERQAVSAAVRFPHMLVIDPGHGGEDGGALAADGTKEAEINLAIALRLQDLCYLSGIETAMTREEDISIHTQGDSIRARKASDIRNRVAFVNGFSDPVLVSIHQNALPQAKSVHGAQVFYNSGEEAYELAKMLQMQFNEGINTDREKACRAIDGAVYLMNHAACPGVLVECGFLSNETDTAKLKTDEHQKKIAMTVAAGYLTWCCGT